MSAEHSVLTRFSFRAGAVGHFLSAGMSIAYGSLVILSFGFYPFYTAWTPGLVVSVAFSLALLLHSVAFYDLWRKYGTRIGGVAFAGGLLAALILMASSSEAFASCGPPLYCYRSLGNSTATVMVVASMILLGTMSILDGVAFLSARGAFRRSGDAVAAGVLFIISGSLIVPLFLAMVVWFLFALFAGFFVLSSAFILGGVVLASVSMRPMASVKKEPPR